LTFKDEEDPARATQAGRAARMCHAAMTFMRTLEAQVGGSQSEGTSDCH
jgi:hypothetical protein